MMNRTIQAFKMNNVIGQAIGIAALLALPMSTLGIVGGFSTYLSLLKSYMIFSTVF